FCLECGQPIKHAESSVQPAYAPSNGRGCPANRAARASGARRDARPAFPMRPTIRRSRWTSRSLWFSLAVSIAFGLSQGNLAGAYQVAGAKAWKAKDDRTAFQEFLPLAEAGDAVAQTMLGTMYSAGHHVPEEPAVAFRWWRQAADQGYGPAQLLVAAAYFRGTGVAVDVGEAFHWASLAAA